MTINSGMRRSSWSY